ncbi:hypothetical protein J0H58_34940 [bacterium]|nr:hypothetical protein [bacterium]
MTTCPPPHVLAALAQDELPPDEAAAVLRHAGQCAACTDALRGLDDLDAVADLFGHHHDPTPEPQYAPELPPPAPAPATADSPFGRWGKYLFVGVAGALGLVVAFGTKVRQQAVAVREADARAEAAGRDAHRATAAASLADARVALARGIAALDDGDPDGADAVAKAAALGRQVAADPQLDDDVKAAATAFLTEADAQVTGWVPPPGPAHPGYHPRLAVLTPSGKRLLTAAADPRVVVWDAATGRAQAACVVKEPAGGRFAALAVSPDGRYAAAGTTDGRVWVWELPEKGEAVPAAQPVEIGGGRPVWVVAFTTASFPADPPVLWAAGTDGVPRARPYVPSPLERKTGSAPPGDLDHESGPGPRVGPVRRSRPVTAAGADPTGRFVFTADPDGTFRYWDAATRLPLGLPTPTPGPAPR